MKKFINLIVIIFLTVIVSVEFLHTAPNINCPTGYVRLTKLVMVNINGTLCQYFDVTTSDFYRYPLNCTSPCELMPEPDDSSIPEPDEEEPFPESGCFGLVSPCSK